MKISQTIFPEVFYIELKSNLDDRGSFTRIFCKKTLKKFKINFEVAQISFATNALKHTLRGMHFQEKPMEEQKFVFCLKGSIWDVIMDVRHKSNTYGKWFSLELSEKKQNCIYIPSGFAHGYLTLSKNTKVLYMMDKDYNPQLSKGVNWNDPEVNIKWPKAPLKISAKDRALPMLNDL